MEKSPRTPNRTPNRTPKRSNNAQTITPKKPPMNFGNSKTANTENTEKALRNVRILRLQQTPMTTFEGLRNYPNVRSIETGGNSKFSIMSFIVALRSLNLKSIDGQEVNQEDLLNSFNYSGLVTFALRQGMDPELNQDPEAALQDAYHFLDPEYKADNYDQIYSIQDENGQKKITVNVKGEYFSWYYLDDEFNWKSFSNFNTNICISPLNYPLKCEIKSGVAKSKKSFSIYVPEYDFKYHIYAELAGDASEGRFITVKAPLSSEIEWRHLDDDSVINSGTLVLPLTPDDVGRVIVCNVTPREGLPETRLLTEPVKAGEFRFRSLRLQGELVEKDEIEFEVSTKGTRAKFVGIRILRSAHHGDWEHIDFISVDNMEKKNDDEKAEEGKKTDQIDCKLVYRLTVEDIGCVIRAVCITEGGGPPLMLTSNERVQPSAPMFKNPHIYGSISVGMPLFAVAQYEGGLQGNCRYEWTIGGENYNSDGGVSTSIPVIVPTKNDVGKIVACRMTPIRNDGSIGQMVEASLSTPVKDNGKVMKESFLEFKKKTRSGRLQMSFVEEKPQSSQKLFVIKEGETVIISQPCDWAVVTQTGIKTAGHSKMFTADADSIKGILVAFSDDFFAIAGQIEASAPTATDVTIICDKNSSFLTVEYTYTGGKEGRSIIQWNKMERNKEVVMGFGRSVHININDKGCSYRSIITPQSLDGKCGTPAASEPFMIDADTVPKDEMPHIKILEIPGDLQQNVEIRVATNEQREKELASLKQNVKPNSSSREEEEPYYVIVSEPISNRYKVVWLADGKQIHEGNSLIPTGKCVGKSLDVQICDRLRETVYAESELPEITQIIASVSDVKLKFSNVDENNQMITVERKFNGGTEGKSKVVWKIFDKDDLKEPISTKVSTEPSSFLNKYTITVDDTAEGSYVMVDYYARNKTQKEFSEPVSSELVQIPIRHPFITITDAEIVPNKEVTELICNIKTEGEGKVTYKWVYRDESDEENVKEEPTGETKKTHVITEKDFEYTICCRLKEYRKDGKFSNEVLVYLSEDFNTLFTCNIDKAVIKPKGKGTSDNQIIIGQEIEVDITEYHGVPWKEMYVTWQRYEGPVAAQPAVVETPKSKTKTPTKISRKKKEEVHQEQESVHDPNEDDENNWKIISNDKTYITSSADTGKKIRAVFDVSATHEMLEDVLYSDKYTTKPVVVSRNNPTIMRIASALFRTKKAVFDAVLPMDEKVTITLENGLFLMKGGSNVLLRAQFAAITTEIIEGSTDTISLKARHGYNTELTFGEKKLSGGTKFSPPQSRELFLETLSLFKQNDK